MKTPQIYGDEERRSYVRNQPQNKEGTKNLGPHRTTRGASLIQWKNQWSFNQGASAKTWKDICTMGEA